MECFNSVICLFIIALVQPGALSYDEVTTAPKIIGGNESVPNLFPYQVGIFLKVWGQDDRVFCGGTLISKDYVLTAAHCVDRAYDAEVILGAHNIFEEEPTQQRFKSKVLIAHGQWNPGTLLNDIGLIKLPAAAKLNRQVQLVNLPRASDQYKSFAFKNATVVGWGVTANKASNISSVLKVAYSKVTLPSICKAAFFGQIGKTQMCIDGHKGVSVCNGDSGGPLLLPNKIDRLVQQGIVSFTIGFGCEAGWPQVFTRVSHHLKWIYEHAGIPIKP